MKKLSITFVCAAIICWSGSLKADNTVGVGLHIGAQHNVGNYKSNDSSILLDPQNNYFMGISCKTNFVCLFARTGVDITYLMDKGKVLENSSNDVQRYTIHYTAVPLFFGLNYQILDIGNFYMGPGCAYILGRGKVHYSDPSLSEEINTSAWGIGFTAGIELDLSRYIRFYFEWEYLDGRAHSVQQTSTTPEWKDLTVDYTGHRLLIGVMYFII